MNMHNFAGCALSVRMMCWLFTIFSLSYFFLYTFFFQHSISFTGCLDCCRVKSPCSFLILRLLLLPMLCPIIGSSIFRVLGFPYPVVPPGMIPCARCLLPCKNSRILHSCCIRLPFGCLVKQLPCIWTIVLLKLIYVIKVVQHLFFFPRLACSIMNLANKHGITLIPTYMPTLIQVEAAYHGKRWYRVVPDSSHSSDCILSLWSTGGGCVGILMH